MPLKKNVNSKRGFTIIEVVLVLAVAGLIFLMVFLALPAMQRSRKDTQRRDQMSNLVAQITQYQANNRNRLPICPSSGVSCTVEPNKDGLIEGNPASDTWAGFYKNYLLAAGDIFEDPNGNPYKLEVQACGKTKAGEECEAKAQRYNAEFYNAGTTSGSGSSAVTTGEGQNYKILAVTGSVCDGEKTVATSGSRKVSIVYRLEGGGTFCQNN